MTPSKVELRCKVESCKRLLAIVDENGIWLQRGGIQANFPDAETANIVCYRCSTMNVFTLPGRRPRRNMG
jgi:hypothetical protein